MRAETAGSLREAVIRLGIPTYLSGMARGLLGRHPLQARHGRSKALREADLIILAGVACDFRLNYGRAFNRAATLVAANLSREELGKNCRPEIAVQAPADVFLKGMAERWSAGGGRWAEWQATLEGRDRERDAEIKGQAEEETEFVNPLFLCQQIEAAAAEESIFIGDGGDFVASAAYILRPRRPLSWLDPGVFGTLGAGAGFALGAKLVRPEAEVWLLYGDGSAAYSLAEFDTFSRHGIPVIGVVGTDGGWAQIAREQVEVFGDAVATELERTAYHQVVEGYGGEGMLVAEEPDVAGCLSRAQSIAASGRPALVNAFIGRTEFRKGSISM
jgi:acetolactate synthase-1/2/3 large subunit